MKRSKQLKNLLVVSILLAVMINSIFYTSQAVAATGESTRKDALSQNSDKNSNNIHDGFNNSKSNNNNNNNHTKPNEMSIQICDKSHPCKSSQSIGNLQ
jgi:competence protein ComGC